MRSSRIEITFYRIFRVKMRQGHRYNKARPNQCSTPVEPQRIGCCLTAVPIPSIIPVPLISAADPL